MEPHTSFNVLDYIVLGTILLSGMLAILTGFVREMYSLFNWAASYFIAVKFYPVIEPYVQKYISKHATVVDVSIFAVFCCSFIILGLIGMLITNFIQGKALTAIDRSLGFVFGLIRGFLIVCLIYLVASAVLWPDIDKQAQEAATAQTEIPDANQPAKPEKQSITMSAPLWLVEARTRPLLAHGANMLKEFIPEKALEKTTQAILDERDVAKNKIDRESQKYISDKPAVRSDQTTVGTDRP